MFVRILCLACVFSYDPAVVNGANPSSSMLYVISDSRSSSSSSSGRSSSHGDGGQNCAPALNNRTDAQARLIRDLFIEYDKRVRPVKNHSQCVDITLTMTLYQLVQVNEPEEFVVINIWMAHTWQDEFLSWDPDEYEGLDTIVVPWESIWLSDTILYNGLDMSDGSSEKRINVELTMHKSDPGRANVRFAFPALYRFSCKMNVYYFPFDRQNCTLVFGSWVYDSRRVDIRPHSYTVKMDNFISNQEWQIVSFDAIRHVLVYSCCPHPYTNVQYHLVMQRQPLFFVCSYVVPTVVVAFTSFLGLFTPSSTTNEREEKITLGISTLLAMSILLLMVSDKMPTAGSYIPMMALFFLCIIVLIATGIALTTVVICVQRQGNYGKRVPPYVQRVFVEILPKYLLLQTRKRPKAGNAKLQKARIVPRTESNLVQALLQDQLMQELEKPYSMEANGEINKDTNCDTMSEQLIWNNTTASCNSFWNNGDGIPQQRTCENSADWIIVADVLERLLLIIFNILLFSLCGITLYAALTHTSSKD